MDTTALHRFMDSSGVRENGLLRNGPTTSFGFRCHASFSLRWLANNVDIKSTEELVAAANTSPRHLKKDFAEWLEKYVDWFSKKEVFVLRKGPLYEYCWVSKLDHEIPEYKELLRHWLHSICHKILKAEGGTDDLLAALTQSLITVNPKAFEEEIKILIRIAERLISELDPKTTAITPETYQVHQLHLSAAYRVMLLIQDISPRQLDPDLEGGVYRRLKEVLQEIIAKSQEYYPYQYYAELVKQSLAGMEITVPRHEQRNRIGGRVAKGIYGILLIGVGIRELAEIKLNAEAASDGIKSLREALKGNGISKTSWCNLIEKLDYGCMLAVQEPLYAEELFVVVDELIRESSSSRDSVLLRFGIVEELISIVKNSEVIWVKTEAWIRLVSIGSICSEATELRHHKHTVDYIFHFAKSVIELSGQAVLDFEAVKYYGLDESEIQGLLSSYSGQTTASTELFEELKQKVGWIKDYDSARQVRDELLKRYQDDDFAFSRMFIHGYPPIPVDRLKFHLSTREEAKSVDNSGRFLKSKTNTRIELEDLFLNIPFGGGLDIEVQRYFNNSANDLQCVDRVVVTGNPGTGKTVLSRKIANLWCRRNWGDQFDAVYVVPVRDVQKEIYDNMNSRRMKTLSTAIANLCYRQRSNEAQFEALRDLIEKELQRETTLVILDGMDENATACPEIVREALDVTSKHKLLVLSRPGGVERWDMYAREVECIGVDDQQLVAYVEENIGKESSSLTLNLLKQNRHVWELAHVPINLAILCVLWEEKCKGQEASTDWNLLSIYDEMADYMWDRFWRNPRTLYENEDEIRENVFDALGKIALDAMKNDQIFVRYMSLRKWTRNDKIINSLTSVGFLFLKKSGRQYHFPHLTFQEYFAGRALARDLFEGSPDEKRKAEQLLVLDKYKQRYLQMLLFAVGEIAKRRKWEGVAHMLEVIDRDPIEITTVHHLLLKAKLLDAAMAVSELPDKTTWELPPLNKVKETMTWLEDVFRDYSPDFENPGLSSGLPMMLVVSSGLGRVLPNFYEHIGALYTFYMLILLGAIEPLEKDGKIKEQIPLSDSNSPLCTRNISWLFETADQFDVFCERDALSLSRKIRNKGIYFSKSPFLRFLRSVLSELLFFAKHFSKIKQLAPLPENEVSDLSISTETETAVTLLRLLTKFLSGSRNPDFVAKWSRFCTDTRDGVSLQALLSVPTIITTAPEYAEDLVQAFISGTTLIHGGVGLWKKLLSSTADLIAKLVPHYSRELEQWTTEGTECELNIDGALHPNSVEDAISNWLETGSISAFIGMLQMLPSMVITVHMSQDPRNLRLVLHKSSGLREWNSPKENIQKFATICHGMFELKDLPEVRSNLKQFEELFGDSYFETD